MHRYLWLPLLFIAGCVPDLSGLADICELNFGEPPNIPTWVQGHPLNLTFGSCASTRTMVVTSVTCENCAVSEELTGQAFVGSGSVHATATNDDTATLIVAARYSDDGTTTSFTFSGQGDHEVALQAECKLIDASELNAVDINGNPIDPNFRDCGSTRSANDVVTVLPKVVTFHGASLPFFALFSNYPGLAVPEASLNGAGWSETSTLITYVTFSTVGAATSITLSETLDSGPSSVVIPIPPCDSDGGCR